MLLRHVSWKGYCALLDEIGDDAVRMTYDDGFLEIAVPSEHHERLKSFIADVIVTTLKRERVAFQPLGSATWKREEKLKGIEADECYYIQNAAAIRGKSGIDLTIDPPPDLAVEAELSRSAIDKLRVHASLGIPEVWRVKEDGEVRFLILNRDGRYDQVPVSRSIPLLTAAIVEQFTKRLPPMGPSLHSEAIAEFEEWLHKATS